MNEIEKLRFRMKNVQKNVTEYRMTVTEAKNLLKDIDSILKLQEKPQQVIVNEPTVINRTIDGGSF